MVHHPPAPLKHVQSHLKYARYSPFSPNLGNAIDPLYLIPVASGTSYTCYSLCYLLHLVQPLHATRKSGTASAPRYLEQYSLSLAQSVLLFTRYSLCSPVPGTIFSLPRTVCSPIYQVQPLLPCTWDNILSRAQSALLLTRYGLCSPVPGTIFSIFTAVLLFTRYSLCSPVPGTIFSLSRTVRSLIYQVQPLLACTWDNILSLSHSPLSY
jgi:hypothetical protein